MNDIKKDLGIFPLEKEEYFEHTIAIFKRNWKYLLVTIILMFGLGVLESYSSKIADVLSKTLEAEKVYRFFESHNLGRMIDYGYKEEYIFGLYLRIREIIETVITFFDNILIFGVIISVSGYIDKDKKQHSFLMTIKSIFRIIKLMIAIKLFGMILGVIFFLPFSKIIALIVALYVIIRGIFVPQEYFYKKNNLIISVKNSFYYMKMKNMHWFFPCVLLIILAFVLKLIISLLIGEHEILFTGIIVIRDISLVTMLSLAYFNITYLEKKKK